MPLPHHSSNFFYIYALCNSRLFLTNLLCAAQKLGGLTLILKAVMDPFVVTDLSSREMDDSSKQTMEAHWFLVIESPTNTSLLPLSLSNIALALNLVNVQIQYNKIRTTKHYTIVQYVYIE